MARVKRGVVKRSRHKKILELARGYRGRNSSCYRIAHEKVEKGLQYAYRDRRKKKSSFRSLWIARINAGVREYGLTYSEFMHALGAAKIGLDRKVLSGMATSDRAAFKALVENAKRFTGSAGDAPA
jgi:large subunit ribosomal protein L20